MASVREHWLALSGGISSLVDALAPELDESTADIVRDFIENREFGLALEWLQAVVIEQSISLSNDQREKFDALARLMNVDLIW
jgi:hypothetical protein